MDVETRQIPRGPPGQVWDERVRDYIEGAPRHAQLCMDYREQHYGKICSKRAHAQQARRECALLTPGFTERHCRRIGLALASKRREVIGRRHEPHPLMQRIRRNMEPGRGRKEGGRGGRARRRALFHGSTEKRTARARRACHRIS